MVKKEKVCWECKKLLDFEHIRRSNPCFSYKELCALWDSEFVEFYCCNCYHKANINFKNEILNTKPKYIKYGRPCSRCNKFITQKELQEIFLREININHQINRIQVNELINTLQNPYKNLLCINCYNQKISNILFNIELNEQKFKEFRQELNRLKREKIIFNKERNRYTSKQKRKGLYLKNK